MGYFSALKYTVLLLLLLFIFYLYTANSSLHSKESQDESPAPLQIFLKFPRLKKPVFPLLTLTGLVVCRRPFRVRYRRRRRRRLPPFLRVYFRLLADARRLYTRFFAGALGFSFSSLTGNEVASGWKIWYVLNQCRNINSIASKSTHGPTFFYIFGSTSGLLCRNF